MNQIHAKMSAAVAIAVLMASALAPAALAADSTVNIKNTGSKSTTIVNVKNKNNVAVLQSNNTNVTTGLAVISNTGNNKANGNSGGNVSVTSGKSTTNVNVIVGGSTNRVTLPDCGCDTTDETVDINNTGAGSLVVVNAGTKNNTFVGQQTTTNVSTFGLLISNTGDNNANWNSNTGTTSVTSGNSKTNFTVDVTGSSNAQL